MSVKVLAISTDFVRNVTEVRIQITENIGRIERVKEDLIVPLDGKFEGITDEMMEAVFAALRVEGMDPFPESEQKGATG
jgi:hypothetical protein